MKDRDPALYLTHVLESVDLARATVEGDDFRRFGESQQLQDAVIRRIEIIGEAGAAALGGGHSRSCAGRMLWAKRFGRASDAEGRPGPVGVEVGPTTVSRVCASRFGPTEEPIAPIRHPQADG